MKKLIRLMTAVLVVSLCIMIPAVAMADDNGMQPGFIKDAEGNTYYYEKSEDDTLVMKTGWLNLGEEKYHFDDETGIMEIGRTDIGEKTYWFDDEGKALRKWQTLGGSTYYFNSANAYMLKGVKTIGSYKYYFNDTTGKMMTGWQKVETDSCYFDPDTGRMCKGFQKIDGHTYYFKSDGYRAYGWKTVDDNRYYFGTKKGQMFVGFHKIGGETYYFSKKNGKMLHGWWTIEGSKYYFGSKTGYMYTGVKKIGKNVYTFTSKGALKRTVYGSKKAICLTFDDGPSIYTPTIISTLKKNGALATFFVVGDRTGTYKKNMKSAISMGCQIGNHTYSHKMLSSCSASTIKSQMKKCNSAVKKNGGVTPTICRTPGGEQSGTIRSNVGMPIILWSVDTLDWKTQNSTSTYNAVMKGAKDGAVVLMHDLYKPTATAVQKIVPALKKKGYQMVTIEEMRLLKGKKLKNGTIYYSFN